MNSHWSRSLPAVKSRVFQSSNRLRILCVDDDPNVSEAIARRLRPLEIDVLHAYSGMQGYWQLVTEAPDAAVVDLAMPNGSGAEMIECVMRNKAIMHIPVIVLTGSNDQAVRRRLFQMGISGFLRKPVTCERLLWELSHYIDLGHMSLRTAADRKHSCRQKMCLFNHGHEKSQNEFN